MGVISKFKSHRKKKKLEKFLNSLNGRPLVFGVDTPQSIEAEINKQEVENDH